MALISLQHVNIRCTDVIRSRDFYTALGLREGDRPPFASTGYWMYLGRHPVVHLVQKTTDEPAHTPHTGDLDHVAFEATGIEALRKTLEDSAIPFREVVIPRDNSIQIFIRDPNGVQLELNFAP